MVTPLRRQEGVVGEGAYPPQVVGTPLGVGRADKEGPRKNTAGASPPWSSPRMS